MEWGAHMEPELTASWGASSIAAPGRRSLVAVFDNKTIVWVIIALLIVIGLCLVALFIWAVTTKCGRGKSAQVAPADASRAAVPGADVEKGSLAGGSVAAPGSGPGASTPLVPPSSQAMSVLSGSRAAPTSTAPASVAPSVAPALPPGMVPVPPWQADPQRLPPGIVLAPLTPPMYSPVFSNPRLAHEPPYERLVLISSRVHNADKVAKAVLPNVAYVVYDWKNFTLQELLRYVKKVLGSQKVVSIAVVAPGAKPGSVGLLEGAGTSPDKLAAKSELSQFWRVLAGCVALSGTADGRRVDLLGCRVVEAPREGAALLKELWNLTTVPFAAADDALGGYKLCTFMEEPTTKQLSLISSTIPAIDLYFHRARLLGIEPPPEAAADPEMELMAAADVHAAPPPPGPPPLEAIQPVGTAPPLSAPQSAHSTLPAAAAAAAAAPSAVAAVPATAAAAAAAAAGPAEAVQPPVAAPAPLAAPPLQPLPADAAAAPPPPAGSAPSPLTKPAAASLPAVAAPPPTAMQPTPPAPQAAPPLPAQPTAAAAPPPPPPQPPQPAPPPVVSSAPPLAAPPVAAAAAASPPPQPPPPSDPGQDVFSRLSKALTQRGKTPEAAFAEFDRDGNGQLTTAELTALMRAYVPDATAMDVKHFQAMLDTDAQTEDRMLSLEEFAQGLPENVAIQELVRSGRDDDEVVLRLQEYLTDNEQVIRDTMEEFDANGNGALDHNELNELVACIPGLEPHEKKFAMAFLYHHDRNRDLRLSYDEVREALDQFGSPAPAVAHAAAPVGAPAAAPPASLPASREASMAASVAGSVAGRQASMAASVAGSVAASVVASAAPSVAASAAGEAGPAALEAARGAGQDARVGAEAAGAQVQGAVGHAAEAASQQAHTAATEATAAAEAAAAPLTQPALPRALAPLAPLGPQGGALAPLAPLGGRLAPLAPLGGMPGAGLLPRPGGLAPLAPLPGR